MTEMIALEILGNFRLTAADGRKIALRSRKARALLAYLLLNGGAPIERERLASLLWPEADLDSARTSLRQALASLRRDLPQSAAAGIAADAATIAFDPSRLRCDALDVRALLRDGRPDALSDALERYPADLLAGFDAHSGSFDEWLAQERRALRREMLAGLERLAKTCREARDAAGERAALERLLALEPTDERAHRARMELEMRVGDPTSALRQYRLCRDLLRRELDVAPAADTEQLHREILKRRRAEPPGESAEAPPVDAESGATHPEATSGTPTMREAVVVVARIRAGAADALDPEAARAATSFAAGAMQAAVTRHGGIFDRVVNDRLLAVFGMHAARGNEPEHAAVAALELAEALAAAPLPLAASIGIASGQLLAASSAEIFPLAGPALGTAIELADTAAANTLLVSDAVQRSLASRERFAFAAQSGERAWQLEREPAHMPRADTIPLAGRRAELALATEVLERTAASSRGRVVLVRGEPGLGKTRLIGQIRRIARERGFEAHCAQTLDIGQSEAERPLATLATSLLGLGEADTRPLAWTLLENAAARGDFAREDLLYLGELLALPVPEPFASLARGLDAEARRHARARVLGHLLARSAAAHPLLVVVEDVHWTTPEETARLADLAALVVALPAVLLMSTRPDNDPCTGPWRARARGCPVATLDLVPLADDEARELAAGYGSLESSVVDVCLRRAEGHPLFLDQLLRAAVAGERALPGSVRALTLAKVDELTEPAKQVLQAAAVLGLEVRAPLLRELTGRAHIEFGELETAGLLVPHGPDDYAFGHALFRDAVYDSTLKTVRREWHRRAAETLADNDAALSAWHFEQAEDSRAAEAYLTAARREHEAERIDHAVALARGARRLAQEPPLLSEAATFLGELLMQAGYTHDAIAAFREAIDFAPMQTVRSRPWLGLAAALRIVDRYDEAFTALDHAEACLEDTVDPALRARIWSLRGNLHFPRGDIDACLAAHEEAHRYAIAADSPLEIARALGGLGDAWYQRGRMRSARDHFARCVALASEHDLPALARAYRPMLAMTRAYAGEIRAARLDSERAAADARAVFDLRAEMLAFDVATGVDLYCADFEAAFAAGDRTLVLARQLGSRRFEIEALGIRGVAQFELGDVSAARAAVAEAAEAARAEAPSYCASWMFGAYAYVLAQPAARRAALDRGEQLLDVAAVSHNHLEFYRYAIEVCIEEQWWEDCLLYAERLDRYTSGESLPWSDLVIERARMHANAQDASRDVLTDALRERIAQMEFHVLGVTRAPRRD
jgi:DNA-binding SARP family transcriptional activator